VIPIFIANQSQGVLSKRELGWCFLRKNQPIKEWGDPLGEKGPICPRSSSTTREGGERKTTFKKGKGKK